MNKIRIAVAGASGRMGRMLVESILKAPDTALVAAFEQPDSPFIGKDAGELVGTARIACRAGTLQLIPMTNTASPKRTWEIQRGQFLATIAATDKAKEKKASAKLKNATAQNVPAIRDVIAELIEGTP